MYRQDQPLQPVALHQQINIHVTGSDLDCRKVEFGGISKNVCLVYTPEVKVGEYVLVHVGFALSLIDETEAQEVFAYLEEISEAMAEDQP